MKRVLIIGAGGIGKRHIRGFLKTGRARVSVCELNPGKLDVALRDYDIDKGYGDLAKTPLDAFDLAVIAAPAHVHVPVGQQLADAGVPFLTEKPLSVSMDGVDRLIETVNEKGLTVRVGYVRRATDWVVRLYEDVSKGRIGKVRMAYANTSQDYRKYRPDYSTIYYAKKAMGGGAILDCASHVVDLLLWLMGPVAEVSAMYDRMEFENVECEDCALISLRFTSGALAHIAINQFQKPNVCTFELIGTRGNLRLLDTTARIQFADDDSGRWETESFISDDLAPMEIHERNFSTQANILMDAVDGKPDRLATLEEARDNLAVCLAAKQSDETKRIVRLHPKS